MALLTMVAIPTILHTMIMADTMIPGIPPTMDMVATDTDTPIMVPTGVEIIMVIMVRTITGTTMVPQAISNMEGLIIATIMDIQGHLKHPWAPPKDPPTWIPRTVVVPDHQLPVQEYPEGPQLSGISGQIPQLQRG